MKYKDEVIIAIVALALISYVLCSIATFKCAFEIDKQSTPVNDSTTIDSNKTEIPEFIAFLSTGLTGLVGSIVARAFGLPVSKDGGKVPTKTLFVTVERKRKLQKLGSYLSKSNDDKTRELFGTAYVIAFILAGLGACLVWYSIGENVIEVVQHTACTFIGIMIVVATSFMVPETE
jgi:hypothetical protein